MFGNYLKLQEKYKHLFVDKYDFDRNESPLVWLRLKYKNEDSPEAFEKAFTVGARQFGIETNEFTVANAYEKFEDMVSSSLLYRTIILNDWDEFDIENLGHSWCPTSELAAKWDPAENATFTADTNGRVPSKVFGNYKILIEATVSPDDIDYIQTAFLLGYYGVGGETEVRTKAFNSAKISRVFFSPTKLQAAQNPFVKNYLMDESKHKLFKISNAAVKEDYYDITEDVIKISNLPKVKDTKNPLEIEFDKADKSGD